MTDAVGLLERAVGYTRRCLTLVRDADLERRTPCAAWDLDHLLRHLDDSFAAFADAAGAGYVDLVAVPATGPVPVARLRSRASAVLAAWSAPGRPAAVAVAGRPVGADLLAGAGALEVAVHGWDVAAACGDPWPLPAGLAADLLDLVPVLVTAADRPARFARPVAVPLGAAPGVRLLAALGRQA